jgi:alkanesulfonate monooxygenase SsuD/methylene tetrahydromethanopterin reductase-like flavin-dependent oxidoreductase (luciferase family)
MRTGRASSSSASEWETRVQVEIVVESNDPRGLLSELQRCEELGFDGFGIPDLLPNGLDVFTLLGAAAVKTSRIRLYPCVANPLSRHAMVLANTASTLNALAPGRFCLMLGSANADEAVRFLGRPPARLAEMREAVADIRRFLAGDWGTPPHRTAPQTSHPLPPICIAASGPRMTALAGEVGDEVLIATGHDRRVISAVRSMLQEGAERAGRSLEGFGIADYAWVHVDDDEDRAFEALKQVVMPYVAGGYAGLTLAALGLDWSADRLSEVPEPEWRAYLGAIGFAGPIEKIRTQFEELAKSGHIDRVVCGISGVDDEAALQAFASTVIPALGGRQSG